MVLRVLAFDEAVTKEEGLRVVENAVATSGQAVGVDYAGESRQIRREGSALTVKLGPLCRAFQGFRLLLARRRGYELEATECWVVADTGSTATS